MCRGTCQLGLVPILLKGHGVFLFDFSFFNEILRWVQFGSIWFFLSN